MLRENLFQYTQSQQPIKIIQTSQPITHTLISLPQTHLCSRMRSVKKRRNSKNRHIHTQNKQENNHLSKQFNKSTGMISKPQHFKFNKGNDHYLHKKNSNTNRQWNKHYQHNANFVCRLQWTSEKPWCPRRFAIFSIFASFSIGRQWYLKPFFSSSTLASHVQCWHRHTFFGCWCLGTSCYIFWGVVMRGGDASIDIFFFLKVQTMGAEYKFIPIFHHLTL